MCRVARACSVRCRELLSEPFLHFLLLGAVLFGINQYLEAQVEIHSHRYHTADRARHRRELSVAVREPADAPTSRCSGRGAYPRGGFLSRSAATRTRSKMTRSSVDGWCRSTSSCSRISTSLRSRANRHCAHSSTRTSSNIELPSTVSFSHVYFSTDTRGERCACGCRADRLLHWQPAA